MEDLLAQVVVLEPAPAVAPREVVAGLLARVAEEPPEEPQHTELAPDLVVAEVGFE